MHSSKPSHTAPADGTARIAPPRGFYVTVLVFLVLTGWMLKTKVDLLAHTRMAYLEPTPAVEVPVAPLRSAEVVASAWAFRFEDLDRHPDRLYASYLAEGLARAEDSTATNVRAAFQELLDLYMVRQGEDDNFTLRVMDNRTNTLLERHVLQAEQAAFARTGVADWPAIDQRRREVTRHLVDLYEAQGIPDDAITVKWGRANQVREAREKEAPFIAYEVRLAAYLGLSLLATEIGTVETFNTDEMVSRVGARGRYQMMPYALRQNGIYHYVLPTVDGPEVKVYEEWHPMLTMVPAFVMMRAYSNAVGHEIPGLSAYHTGPYNIFKTYHHFLTDSTFRAERRPNVVDAYMWALTDGFETIARRSSFGSHSRGYLPSVYGALRSTEGLPVDTSRTFLAERVQLRAGATLSLSELLAALQSAGTRLDWRGTTPGAGLYNHFRALNPHIDLPAAPDSLGVPVEGDLVLVDAVGKAAVRFFLPLGASRLVAEVGYGVLDDTQMVRYDHNTFVPPPAEAITDWDVRYAALVDDIARFGFTEENRALLQTIAEAFDVLAEETPTPYRQIQREVARLHRQVWRSERWDALAQTTATALGTYRVPVQPPDPVGTTVSE